MSWKVLLASCVAFAIKWLLNKWEKDKERKSRKDEALAMVREGIKKRDARLVTSGFGVLNRM